MAVLDASLLIFASQASDGRAKATQGIPHWSALHMNGQADGHAVAAAGRANWGAAGLQQLMVTLCDSSFFLSPTCTRHGIARTPAPHRCPPDHVAAAVLGGRPPWLCARQGIQGHRWCESTAPARSIRVHSITRSVRLSPPVHVSCEGVQCMHTCAHVWRDDGGRGGGGGGGHG